MSEITDFDPSSTPAVEVRVYREGHLVTTEWCDSEAEAAEVTERWRERAGFHCVVDNVSGAGPVAAQAEAGDEDPVDGGDDDRARAAGEAAREDG
jgi:hypothetical protein